MKGKRHTRGSRHTRKNKLCGGFRYGNKLKHMSIPGELLISSPTTSTKTKTRTRTRTKTRTSTRTRTNKYSKWF